MPNPFVKAWKYSMAWFGAKVDEKADPKIQIQQAIEEAQLQHQALSQQAAQVIGNQRQLEMRLSRQMDDVAKLRASARQAIIMADKARAGGDEAKAVEYEQAAQSFASQLVSGEKNMEDLKTLHEQAMQAAQQAKESVERNSVMLREKLTERTQLLSQLEQAKMQESVSASLQQMSEMAAPGDVPTLGEVRDKIERRYATALGQAELASTTTEGRMIEVQKSAIDMASASRLDEIRASLRQDQLTTAAEKPAVESGEPSGEKPQG